MNGIDGTFAQRAKAILDLANDRLDHMVIAAGLDPAVDLRYGDWRGFDLSGADLRGFNFTGADLTGARFDNAFIAGAIFDHTIYDPALLRKAADYEEFLWHATAGSGFAFSAALESTLHRALAYANRRKHQYATLEHLLLALIDDVDASAAMKACKVDLAALKGNLTNYIDNDLKTLVTDDVESRPTAAFQRVIQRAVVAVQSSGRQEVMGAHVLVTIFAERESHAAYFLQEQEMTGYHALNYIDYFSHGTTKGGGHTAV
jgi:hypothetical protein